jgi:hypothetical protein
MSETKYWIIVASRDHVKEGQAEGFAQACHGKASPLRSMKPGDYVIYYSGKETFGEKQLCQQFTAIGRVQDDKLYIVQMTPDFCPARRDIEFLPARDVPIRPLINELQFIRNKQHWGYAFRFGFLEIRQQDYALIAGYMLRQDALIK